MRAYARRLLSYYCSSCCVVHYDNNVYSLYGVFPFFETCQCFVLTVTENNIVILVVVVVVVVVEAVVVALSK